MSTFEEHRQEHSFVPFAQEPPPGSRSRHTTAAGIWQQMWLSRPVRLPTSQGSDAKIAGVCEGIGVRYQIDPVLIRLFFVVSGIFGAGIAAYLLLWLVLPRYSVPVSPLESLWKPGHPEDRTRGWWLLIAFIVFSGLFSSGASSIFGPASVLTYAALVAMWWGLHHRLPVPPRGLLANGYQPPATALPTADHPPTQDVAMNQNPDNDVPRPQPDLSHLSPAEGYQTPFAREYRDTPAWDPLSQNQQHAWNLQMADQYGTEPVQKKRALWPWFAAGLVGLGAMVTLATSAAFQALDPAEGPSGASSGIGDLSLSPTNADLRSDYSSGIGELNLDFRGVTTLEQSRDVHISSGIGEVTVVLPENVPLRLNCSTGLGTAHCDVGDLDAHNAGLPGEPLNISVSSGIGDITVELPARNEG